MSSAPDQIQSTRSRLQSNLIDFARRRSIIEAATLEIRKALACCYEHVPDGDTIEAGEAVARAIKAAVCIYDDAIHDLSRERADIETHEATAHALLRDREPWPQLLAAYAVPGDPHRVLSWVRSACLDGLDADDADSRAELESQAADLLASIAAGER